MVLEAAQQGIDTIRLGVRAAFGVAGLVDGSVVRAAQEAKCRSAMTCT